MNAIGFCIRAEGEDKIYHGCVTLGHEGVPKKAKAKFDNGLLKIGVPFKQEPMERVKLVGAAEPLF